MGNIAHSVLGMLLALGTVLGTTLVAEAKPKLATTLPSQVKTTKIKKPRRVATAPKQPSAIKQESREIANQEDLPVPNFTSRTVHFWRSTARLPTSYRCDEEMAAQKMHEAELQALDECAAKGLEFCEVHSVKIEKSGALDCRDLLGNECRPHEYYAGCVAKAVVIGKIFLSDRD